MFKSLFEIEVELCVKLKLRYWKQKWWPVLILICKLIFNLQNICLG